MNVSIIIVNYNSKQLIDQCIKSILVFTKNISYEIIVVDNASNDGSQEFIKYNFPNIILIENKENLGFGRANNLGVKSATGKYLFFLNPDCVFIENALKKMFDFFETQNNAAYKIGAVGCMLLDMDHKLNTSYNRFPTPCSQIKRLFIDRFNRLFNTNLKLEDRFNYLSNKNYEVDFITGADLFVPKDIFDSLNGFDPTFFMYYEETDLQKRMSKVSFKRVILSNVRIIHLEGGTTKKKLLSTTIFIDSEFKYMKKHYPIYIYVLYYIFMSILLIPTLFMNSHSIKEKKEFLYMLIRNSNPFI